MACYGRGNTQAQEDEQRREERAEQHRLQLQSPRSMVMVVRPSWRGLRGWLHLLLKGEVEKIFCAIKCAEEDRVSLATYMLQAGERDGLVHGREEGDQEEVSTTIPEVG
ncbi:hypothetical protein Taro_037109 [Colocasia esculenta]|uniref:Uncharacterized protein n=1 Tax=Colocasia esculenta TaxID=4460 RepID=A0A843WBT1_COLES|nr:hypothetical protein [Colocasia esculenta]